MNIVLVIITSILALISIFLFFVLNNLFSFILMFVCLLLFFASFKVKTKKKDETPVPTIEIPKYIDKEYQYTIYDQDEAVINKFYRFYKYELQVDDEYGKSSKELKDDIYYDEKIFKYLPYICYQYNLDGNVVYVKIDGEYYRLGVINEKALDEISESFKKYLVYNHGEYKFYDYNNDKVVKSEMDSYFTFNCVYKE